MSMTGNHPGLSAVGDSKSIYVPGSRTHPSQRRLRNWPLEPVELALPVTEADFVPGAQWPPHRMTQRLTRLNVYERLYRGDMRDFCQDRYATVVAVNYFGLLCDEYSSMLSSTMPEPAVASAVQDGAVDITRFGRCYVVALDGYAEAYDPRLCFEDVDGETLWVLTPYATHEAQDGFYDAAMVYRVGQGTAEAFETRLAQTETKGSFDDLTFTELVPTGTAPGGWGHADRPPALGGWGPSAFDPLIPIAFEIAKRYTSNSWVMDAHQFPLRMMAGSVADVAKQVLRDFEHDGPGWDNADTQNAVSHAMATHDTLWVGDGIDARNSKYLTWDGQLAASFEQIEMLKGELRLIVAISAALEQEGGATPSGTALAQMDARSLRRGTQLWLAMTEALGEALGREPEWDNPFEIPEPTPVADMADTEGAEDDPTQDAGDASGDE